MKTRIFAALIAIASFNAAAESNSDYTNRVWAEQIREQDAFYARERENRIREEQQDMRDEKMREFVREELKRQADQNR